MKTARQHGVFGVAVVLSAILPRCGCLVLQGSRAPSGEYPVSRVVALLRDMKSSMEKEADAEQETYEKLACWCTTGEKEKTKSITDGEAHLAELQATIEKMTALSATLKVEIEALKKEIARNQEALDEAVALREKQKAGFLAEEKEMIESIQALRAAVVVLSKHHGGAGAALLREKAVVKAVALAKAHAQRHDALLTSKQRRVLGAFAQGDFFGSTPGFKQAYQPQSGEVFGILKQMEETFSANLAESQKDEVAAQSTFEAVKLAKSAEINTGQDTLEDKTQQLSNAEVTLVESKNDREDTEASVAADKNFLTELKVKCALTDKEWENRQKLRQEELAAVSEAIDILSSDEARELFNKVYNKPAASLVQFTQRRQDSVPSLQRQRAVQLLEKAAAKTHSGRIDKLIGSVRLDAFVRVKKAIDDMVAEILREKEDEVKLRDSCISELNGNERSTAKVVHSKKNIEAKIEGLGLTITGLNGTISELTSQIADLKTQREEASKNRKQEKSDYEALVAEQQQAADLLQKAYDALKLKFAALVQQSPFGNKPPPPDLKDVEKNRQAPGVLLMIEHIIENTKNMQQAATDAEAEAQDAYTQYVEETTKSVEAKEAAILDRTQERAQAQKELEEAKMDLDGTITEIDALAKSEGDLHASCDYLLKNFEVRQAARDQEVEALRQAKAFLSGMQ